MSDSELYAAIRAWELVAKVGVVLVIIGVLLEGSELLVKWGGKRRFRQRFKRLIRRRLVVCVKWIRPKIPPLETVGFIVLVIGLAVEFIGTSFVSARQGEANSILNKEAGEARRLAAELEKHVEELRKENLVLRSDLWTLEHASPEKKPVFSAYAFVSFTIESTNFIQAKAQTSSDLVGDLSLTRRSEPLDNIANIFLAGDKFSQFGNRIAMELGWSSPILRGIVGTNQNETSEELIAELNRGTFTAILFKSPVTVSDAKLTLVLNGVVKKDFQLGLHNRPPDGFPGVMFDVAEITNTPSKKQ